MADACWVRASACASALARCYSGLGSMRHTLDLSRFSLRFKNVQKEKGFLHSRSEQLLGSLFQYGVIILVVSTTVLATMEWRSEDYPSMDAFNLSLRIRAAILGFGLYAIFVMCGTCLLSCFKSSHLVACEIGSTFLIIFAMVLLIFTDTWYAAKIYGLDPVQVFIAETNDPIFSDSRLLLTIVAIVLLSHMLLPIRWFVMWPVEITGLLIYVVVSMLVGSSEKNRMVKANSIVLAGLIVSAAVGKRKIELYERHAFYCIVAERTSRCTVEFHLEQAMQEKALSSQKQSLFDSEVTTATSSSGSVFGNLVTPHEIEESKQLMRLCSLGRKEHWLLDSKDVHLLPNEIIGSGTYGLVIAARFRHMKVAVKTLNCLGKHTNITWKGSEAHALANEIRILRRVRHPNVVLFYGACIDIDSKEFALVLELVMGRRLIDLVGVPPELPNMSDRCRIICDIGIALVYLHGNLPPIVHGDLSGTNIIVEKSSNGPRAKLIDFGLARLLTKSTRSLGGSSRWMAPEMHQSMYDDKTSADVFSFGRLMHFIMSGRIPHQNWAISDIKILALTGWSEPVEWTGFKFPDGCKTLTDDCLKFEAAIRPSILDCLDVVMSWSSSKFDATQQLCPESWSPALKQARSNARSKADAIGGGLDLGAVSESSSMYLEADMESSRSWHSSDCGISPSHVAQRFHL